MPERELARQADEVVLDLTAERMGGPRANVAIDSRLISSTAQFARCGPAALAENVRGMVRDDWPSGSGSEKPAISPKPLPPWYAPAGGWTSAVSKMWLVSLLFLILSPGCLALWIIESPKHFEVNMNNFSWPVFCASLALALAMLKMLPIYVFENEMTEEGFGCAALIFLAALVGLANYPHNAMPYLCLVVTGCAAFMTGLFVTKTSIDVEKYRWVLGLSVACMAILSADGFLLPPRELASEALESLPEIFVNLNRWAYSQLSPLFLGISYAVAAIFAGYAIGSRAGEVERRMEAVTEANRILATFYDQAFARVAGRQRSSVSDIRTRSSAGSLRSPTAGRQQNMISETDEENEDAFCRARVTIREGVNQVTVVTFRWHRNNNMTAVVHRAVIRPDVAVHVSSEDWGRLGRGAVSAHQLVSQRLLTVDGPPELVRQFLGKIDSHFAKKP